jgi:uncharacterized membrane protein (UPF0127 family)
VERDPQLPRRLRGYPVAAVAGSSLSVSVATTFRARLLGLAGLRPTPRGIGLLLPHTCSVHTFGMRFAIDLIWLDEAGGVMRVDRSVPPRRVCRCAGAWGVVELAARDTSHRGEAH